VGWDIRAFAAGGYPASLMANSVIAGWRSMSVPSGLLAVGPSAAAGGRDPPRPRPTGALHYLILAVAAASKTQAVYDA